MKNNVSLISKNSIEQDLKDFGFLEYSIKDYGDCLTSSKYKRGNLLAVLTTDGYLRILILDLLKSDFYKKHMCDTLFFGKIEDKSQLRELLKQVNVDNLDQKYNIMFGEYKYIIYK